METNAHENASSNRRPTLVAVIPGLILLLASGWLLARQSADAKAILQKWMLITDELGSDLPPSVAALHKVVTATAYWPLIAFSVIGLLSLIFVLIRRRRYSIVAWCAAVVLLTVGASAMIQSQMRVPDQWLAKEMEVPLPLAAEQIQDSVGIFEDKDQPHDARLLAARTIRTIGLKHAAGLLRIDSADTRPLIEIAQDSTANVELRFLAAFALFPIDHSGDDACQAIAEAMRAASLSGDTEMRDTAKRYLTLPSLQRDFSTADGDGS